jgi:hypothetical protein
MICAQFAKSAKPAEFVAWFVKCVNGKAPRHQKIVGQAKRAEKFEFVKLAVFVTVCFASVVRLKRQET